MFNKKLLRKNFTWPVIFSLLFVIFLCFLNYYILINNPDRGTIGDMFGVVNSLFSGLAFAGIIFTILLQSKELKLQREEIKSNRDEFKTQNNTLKIQRFENTFFNLLQLHHQIVHSIDYRYYKSKEKAAMYQYAMPNEEKEIVTIQGRDVFRYRFNKMKNDIKNDGLYFEDKYQNHYLDAQSDFGHYFRNLYRIIKFIDESEFFYDDQNESEEAKFKIKYQYTSFVRAQLSDYELIWLFYNCLSRNGKEKFKPLIEKYALFKNLPFELIANEELINRYNVTAYKN